MHTLPGATPDFDHLLIFGAGGFGREVAWLARQALGASVTIEFVVDRPEYLSGAVSGLPVRLLSDCVASPRQRYVVALGDPIQRQRVVAACDALGLLATRLVHPRVEASDSVALGEGSVICAGSILTVDIDIRAHVQVNLGCTLGHDVVVGSYSTLAPGVHVSGNVLIGNAAYIGTGASIINGSVDHPLTIGDGAVVAAGACVTRSVEPGAMVAGVPAVRKR